MMKEPGSSGTWTQRPGSSFESSVYGLIVVSAMLIVMGRYGNTSAENFFKVLGTVVVFWAAHLFAVCVAHLNQSEPGQASFRGELSHAWRHSAGLLLAAVIPLGVLLLGVLGVISDEVALWTALWVNVVLLGVVGYLSSLRWAPTVRVRLVVSGGTALLGLLIVGLKVFLH
ncbi:hypothetical protein [Arthrobacter rhombi]|uniref:hypothetical protein n=1 Tax=Arthrobacter rhombi TaxID=71253 RepID=UPI003FD264A2